ncbi:MAG: hypothetical protein AB8G15_14070 [Saprospiraceae bacterium]
MKKINILIITLLLITACKEKSPPFPYTLGLNSYVAKVLGYDLKKVVEETIIFLPLEYCPSCITEGLQFVSQQEKQEKTTLVFIGNEETYPDDQPYIQQLKKRYPYKVDAFNKHHSYACGINKPLLVQIKDGKIVDYIYLEKDNFEKAKRFFI